MYLHHYSEAEEPQRTEADEGAEGGDEQEAGLASDKPVLPSRREIEKIRGQQRGQGGDEF